MKPSPQAGMNTGATITLFVVSQVYLHMYYTYYILNLLRRALPIVLRGGLTESQTGDEVRKTLKSDYDDVRPNERINYRNRIAPLYVILHPLHAEHRLRSLMNFQCS